MPVALLLLPFIVLFLPLSVSLAAPGPDVHAIAQAVDNHYNHLRTLEADFTEIYRGAGIERTESGTLWLKKPGKMRWEYRSPKEKLFLSDGQNAWFYVPGDRQVTKTPVRKLDDLRSPLGLLLGKTKLEKELQELSLAPDVAPVTPGDVVIRGVPKAMADRLSQVILEISPDDRIARILIEGVDESVTEYRFDNQKENVEIDSQGFRFVPPEGVEVVERDFGP
ncbi:MAG TPA: outer membrane lipoprotein chaperone LolA [Terriglobales bacterium]|nr:outer membrane lipoprotein chaperone LolA [Terriglobales bacterium]